MEQFDINKIVAQYKLDVDEVAKVLFPTVKHPKLAFDRILKGESYLDSKQIEALASYIGVLVSDLFLIDSWKCKSKAESFIFSKGEYKVKLYYKCTYLSIYKGDTVISKDLFITKNMSFSDFIDYINNIIKTFENGNN